MQRASIISLNLNREIPRLQNNIFRLESFPYHQKMGEWPACQSYRFMKDSIVVDINGLTYDVPVVKWQKIEYSYNEAEDKIEAEVAGLCELVLSHNSL